MAIHQKLVTSRLLELNKFMTKISLKHDTSLRVQISGNDEISNLAGEMNRMLEELNKTHEDNQRLIGEVLGYDELKNEFFSNISHEFRTPINVLLSTLQLINLKQQNAQAGSNPFDVEKYTNIMRQNCYRLLRLANNLIDISKIDSGYFEINPSNCNVVEIIEEITLSVAEYMQEKGISLQFDTDVEEKIISMDADKIERIMLNLLSNAIKFTEENGSIYVNIKDKGETIVVSVRDTGIGIPEDKLSIIFERFRQVNSSLARSHEGSGIGLSLVKNLVELHGGSISVNSDYGIGAEFIFTLPAKVSLEEAEQNLSPMTSQGKVDKINIEFSDIYS
jgi:two-component system CheB/CheR fusion protein